jgi:3-hydroxybutyryl-CoA dehydratase
MQASLPMRRGLYFEEFSVGQTLRTPGRTLTEADIIAFAGLSGDFNLIHTDAVYAATTPFGQRVAHGLLGLAIASGLAVRSGVLEGTVLAFREIQEWKFSQPVFIGDTLTVEMKVSEVKALPRLGGGSVVLELSVMNQTAAVVMKGSWNVLVQSRPGA